MGDSRLLTQMAEEGMGSYSFIPDAGFVGTVFVNTMSNLLVTMGVKAMLNLQMNDSAVVRKVMGSFPTMGGANNRVLIGSLQYDQSRDIVLEVEGLKTGQACMEAGISYEDISGSRVDGTFGEGTTFEPSPDDVLDVERHRLRNCYVEGVCDALHKAEQGRTDDNLQAAASVIKELCEEATKSTATQSGSQTPAGALLEDISGQTTEAFHKIEWYWKWGRHYMPSIMSAHKLQQCNNFKDPGVQFYGGALFEQVRDQADAAFNDLPAPKPSRAQPVHGASVPAPVSMAAYNDRYAG